MSRLQNKTRIVHEKGMEMRRMGAKNDMRGGGTIVFIRELRKNVSAFNGTNSLNLIHENGMRLMLCAIVQLTVKSANVRRKGENVKESKVHKNV